MRKQSIALPTLGKITPQYFSEVISTRLGAPSAALVQRPQNGVDCGVVDLGAGQVMAMSTDPFFILPQLGWERAAWFAVHIIASDVATSGLPPRFMSIDLNLPPSMTEAEFAAMWEVTHKACDEIGVSVVAGHTGRYEGCNYPMIGGATIMATGSSEKYVSVGMTQPGDEILMTKGAAVEAAGLLSACFPQRLSPALRERSQEIFWKMSTVADARIAASVGLRDEGVSAMHDATECGVYGGLFEMAQAAGVGMLIDRESIPVSEEVAELCQLFDIDPYTAISEGTLLLSCRPHKSSEIVAALQSHGILAAKIGVAQDEPTIVLKAAGQSRQLPHPTTDPFWAAFAREAARAE